MNSITDSTNRKPPPKLALLRLQEMLGLSSPMFGGACALLVFLVVASTTVLVELKPPGDQVILGSALFFASSIGLVASFLKPLLDGANLDLQRLAAVLPESAIEQTGALRYIDRRPASSQWRSLFVSLIAGLLHSYWLGHLSVLPVIGIPQTLVTTLLWIVMLAIAPKLIENARLFARLGSKAEPDLLRPTRHAAFGTAALRPGLLIIGLLSAYGLLFIADDDPLVGSAWIGFALSLATLVGTVALSLRGIRRRIREVRIESLEEIDARLASLPLRRVAGAGVDKLAEIDLLLDMRERIAQAPGWPFDLAGLQRILLYIVVPPLTWAAAALVEMVIESIL
ncbi:MAG: hypothetical protein AAF671_12885 [Pseudomonadota bacterium]